MAEVGALQIFHNALITQKYTDKANEDVPLTV